MPSPMPRLPEALIVLAAMFSAPAMAEAASPQAWQALRKDVEASCLKAAVPLVANPQIVVDPRDPQETLQDTIAYIRENFLGGGVFK